ncbi:hypothetical protein QBC33DRAFT_579267 [Phialemonium atrogriseum]|uniref:Aminoglycoside phosphotransferase domain-containing protein n=1 Tax=Phialemonium atrogriseum TaxID=1093897 RepID=A0AAJ0BYW8_9PEZI|nr:uncharacterized protein QBC33DRAFT_579267 [Phialemonium atrogriseum]KAK1765978.1 hypothetical protein QBC33DRAFT_579267 [Phialemonium atrogriseum]
MAKTTKFQGSQFNVDALVTLAGALRNQPCTCDISKPPTAGSMNWAVIVAFDDGVEWIFRSPHSGMRAFFDEKTACKLLSSEVATLEYIRSHTTVPVPEVFASSASCENDIGVPYIVMSKAAGHSLAEYDWRWQAHQPPQSSLIRPLRPLSQTDMEKIMSQLGAMTLQLWQLRLNKVGSLFQDGNDGFVVGECLSPSLMWQQRDSLEGIDRGPFSDERAYFNALLSAYISHAEELPFAVNRWNDFVTIGQKIDHSNNRLAYCIAGQLMREMSLHLCSGTADGGFPLGHPDLNTGNIFVDQDLNITCIIDWTSASSGSVSPPDSSLIAAFRAGFERASGGAQLGPNTWEQADMMCFFQRLVGMRGIRDYHHFEAFYALIHASKWGKDDDDDESVNIPGLFEAYAQRAENRLLLDELREGDWSADYIREQEQASFGSAGAANDGRVAVARKLTLMLEMNKRFVADRRLWQWIEEALKYSN